MALALILSAALALPSAPKAEPVSPALQEIREQSCDVLVKMGDREPVIVPGPDLHVLDQTAKDGTFQPALPSGTIAIICQRNGIVPAEHDDEVPRLGLRFYVGEAESSRVATLELINGFFRYRLLEGEFRPGEEFAVKQRLVDFEKRPH